jgi:hypothetical protein
MCVETLIIYDSFAGEYPDESVHLRTETGSRENGKLVVKDQTIGYQVKR